MFEDLRFAIASAAGAVALAQLDLAGINETSADECIVLRSRAEGRLEIAAARLSSAHDLLDRITNQTLVIDASGYQPEHGTSL